MNASDYIKFKATQYFRLRGISIPKTAEAQRELLATIPRETKVQWAMELSSARELVELASV